MLHFCHQLLLHVTVTVLPGSPALTHSMREMLLHREAKHPALTTILGPEDAGFEGK